MFQLKSSKPLATVTLALIMLGSALAAIQVRTVQAQTHFTLWASLCPDPFWGYYGGYHDAWYKIQPEWEKMGIDLELYFQGDMYDNWYLIWEAPLGGRPSGKPPGHWDLTSMEWWMHLHGFLWLDAIMLSKYITPYGANTEPYLRQESDELYWKMQTSLEADVRKAYALEWQRYMMHDPPIINWYYAHVYRFAGSYIQGYDDNLWEQDLSHLRINITDEIRPHLTDEVIMRLETEKTVIFGADEAWWSYLGIFIDSYTEERYQDLVWGRLYKSTLTEEGWSSLAEEAIPAPEDYTIEPYLASDFPTYMDPFEEDGEEVVPVWIPLRQGVVWSDGDPFDAQDVKFTYDLVLDPYVLSTGYGDFAPIVKRVEYCNASGYPVSIDDPDYDPYKIRLVLHDAYADLLQTLMNDWGCCIIPYHALSHISPTHLRGSRENKMFAHAKDLPSIGPFVFEDEGTPSGYSWISLKNNTNYFGYDLGWGPYDIERYIFKYVPDATTRFAAIQTHAVDFGEYPTAPVEVYESPEIMGDPTLLVRKALYPASNDVWMNFNNPQLSNRYVRLALAYATPYDAIYAEILPSWGIVDPIPGTTFVLPWSVYTEPEAYGNDTVRLYNTELIPYSYDLATAQKYLDMWLYSQTGYDTPEEYNKGCVGDADFDGIVDLDDLWYWLEEWGNAPLTRQIDWWDTAWSEGIYPWPLASGDSVAPGNDVDADFNNDGNTDGTDFTLWFENWGKEYPFPGAW